MRPASAPRGQGQACWRTPCSTSTRPRLPLTRGHYHAHDATLPSTTTTAAAAAACCPEAAPDTAILYMPPAEPHTRELLRTGVPTEDSLGVLDGPKDIPSVAGWAHHLGLCPQVCLCKAGLADGTSSCSPHFSGDVSIFGDAAIVGNRCSRSGVRNVPVPYSSWGPVPNTDRVLSRTIRSMLLACHCVSVCLSLELCACVTKQSPRPLALALSAHGANSRRPPALALLTHPRGATQQNVHRRGARRSVSATATLVSPVPLLLQQ